MQHGHLGEEPFRQREPQSKGRGAGAAVSAGSSLRAQHGWTPRATWPHPAPPWPAGCGAVPVSPQACFLVCKSRSQFFILLSCQNKVCQ